MTVTRQMVYTLQCDDAACQNGQPQCVIPASSKRMACWLAEERGWFVGERTDYTRCPACARRRR